MKKILLFTLMLFFVYSYSQNDLCNNAITLTPNTNCVNTNGTFSGSSISATAPSCAPVASQDVWYQFVATAPTMSVWVSTSTSNVAFEILQNSCDGSSTVCVNNNASGSGEFYLNNNFVVGQTYLVRVLNASTTLSTSAFNICIQNYPTPVNDLCANAITLTPNTNCVNTNGTFSGSSISATAPSCAPVASQDVWYQFVATAPTMSVWVSTSTSNVAFEILQNSCDGSSTVCVNNNASGSGEFYLNNNFVVGQTYLVRVLNASTTLSTSAFNICIQNYPTPVNDLCANAITLTPNTNCVNTNGTFSGSSISATAPSCAPVASQDVWYQFVATAPTMSVWVSTSTSNVAFEILQNSCDGSSTVCVNNNASGSGEFYLNNNFVVGQTYLVRVLNASTALSTSAFNICIQNPNLETIDVNTPTITIYPNPVNNELNISSIYDIADINIYDSVGKNIPVILSASNTVNVSNLSSGIYIIKITDTDSNTFIKRFIKQ